MNQSLREEFKGLIFLKSGHMRQKKGFHLHVFGTRKMHSEKNLDNKFTLRHPNVKLSWNESLFNASN